MKATTGTHMVRGGRKDGAVEHFTVSPNLSLCGRFVLPGLGTGKRACKTCVRVGRIVIDHGKGEGCEWSDSRALEMLDWVATQCSARQSVSVRGVAGVVKSINAEFYKSVSVDILRRVKSTPENARKSLESARDWSFAVLMVNAYARGEIQPTPKIVKAEKPKLIMNTAITESEEAHNGGPVMPKASMPKGDGMVNPNSKSKAKSGPAATDAQLGLIRKLYAEMDELKPHEFNRVELFDAEIAPTLTKKNASNVIESTIALVKKTRAEIRVIAPKAETPKCEGMRKGVYVLDGEFYRWTISQGSGRPYALRWDGSVWDYDSARGIVRKLTPDMAVTAEQAAAWGHEHDSCVFCSRPLDDSRSREAGYGSTCADNHGLPWG